jgi:hypothetical protein
VAAQPAGSLRVSQSWLAGLQYQFNAQFNYHFNAGVNLFGSSINGQPRQLVKV